MTKLTGPGQAALEAAARRGITLPPHVAEEAAAAALAHSDRNMGISRRVDRHQWGRPDLRQDVRQQLRRELACRLADEGAMAAGPVTETLTYTQGWMPGAEVKEVPAAAAENGDVPWDHVEVAVSVPARTVE